MNMNDIIDHVLGLKGPTELDRRRLRNALLALERQELRWTAAEARFCHAKKKLGIRRRLLEVRALRTFGAVCRFCLNDPECDVRPSAHSQGASKPSKLA